MVVIIIGILAAIAIPTFLSQRTKAQITTCVSDTRNAAEAAVLYAADNDPTNDFLNMVDQDLVDQGFNQTEGYVTAIGANPGADVTLTTNCAGDAAVTGTATWSTVAGQFRGEVQHTIP